MSRDPKVRSTEDVQAEVERLKEMKPYVRQFSAFSEDHHAAIDAQLEVLKGHMTEMDIYSCWQAKDDDGEPDDNADSHELDEALAARAWMDRSDMTAPSEAWKELDRRTQQKTQPAKGAKQKRMKKT